MARYDARHRAVRPGWFGRGRTRALLSAGVLVGAGAVATSAYWQDGAQVSGASVEAGAIHIDLATNSRVKPETYTWSAMTGSLSTAGASQARVLRVTNNSAGGLTFGYTVAATATGPLGAALKVTVLRGGTVSGSTCTGGTTVGAANASLNGYSGSPGNLSSTAATPFHDLCVQVSLPAGSGVANGATSTVTFTFSASQVIS